MRGRQGGVGRPAGRYEGGSNLNSKHVAREKTPGGTQLHQATSGEESEVRPGGAGGFPWFYTSCQTKQIAFMSGLKTNFDVP